MKAWRKAAAIAKKVAVKTGKHQRGQRYGRIMKAVMGGASFKAPPTPLFFQLAAHGGYIKLDI